VLHEIKINGMSAITREVKIKFRVTRYFMGATTLLYHGGIGNPAAQGPRDKNRSGSIAKEA
jgi:hypothetical protein